MDGAPKQVNIDSGQRTDIGEYFNEDGDLQGAFPPNIFEDAEKLERKVALRIRGVRQGEVAIESRA